jgi:hypothetical protein
MNGGIQLVAHMMNPALNADAMRKVKKEVSPVPARSVRSNQESW